MAQNYKIIGETNRRVDVELTAGTGSVGIERDIESVASGGVVDVLSTTVTQVLANITKEVAISIVDLDNTPVGDLDRRYAGRVGAADGRT